MKMNVLKFTLWVQLHQVVKMMMDYEFVANPGTGMFAVDGLEKRKIRLE
jgi:hypothetical protein